MRRVGIIGGGQLGKMLIEHGFRKISPLTKIIVLDPAGSECCCAKLSGVEVLSGSLYDKEALRLLRSKVDIVTAEIEHFDSSVFECPASGALLIPSPHIFKVIANKADQKRFLQLEGVPVAPFLETDGKDPDFVVSLISIESEKVVIKTCRGGYDGKGVFVLTPDEAKARCESIAAKNGGTVLIEKYLDSIEFDEMSVIVATNGDKDVAVCSPVLMTFRNNILDECCSVPSGYQDSIRKREAIRVALKTVEAFCGTSEVGIFAVEMFVSKIAPFRIFVNEVAPRVHNSGHHTIDTQNVSQFELAARIVLGFELCVIRELRHGFRMTNLIGDIYGAYKFDNPLGVVPSYAKIYDYDKGLSRPGRKLGHVTEWNDYDEDQPAPPPFGKLVKVRHFKPYHSEPVIGVVMGSESDFPIMSKACDMLQVLDVPFEVTVVSAHRTPDRLRDYATTALSRGLSVVIAGAGGAAHLPGMIAAFAPGLPVIGVPLNRTALGGSDSLHSIVQMPAGVPVACMAIDGAANAALFAVMTIEDYRHKAIHYQTQRRDTVNLHLTHAEK